MFLRFTLPIGLLVLATGMTSLVVAGLGTSPLLYAVLLGTTSILLLFVTFVAIRLSREVHQGQEMQEALLHCMGEGVLAVDLQGNIVSYNPAAVQMLLWGREDLLGAHYSSVLLLRSRDGTLLPPKQHFIHRAISTRTSQRTTSVHAYECERKDGSRFPIGLTATPLIIGTSLKGAIATFRDVTEETHMDRMKSEFISLANHQLRTPLTAIGWYIELLQKEAGPKLASDQKEYLEQIADSHQRMVNLVNTLLNVSRVELGRLRIKSERTDISAMVRNLLKEMRPQIEKKSIQFAVDMPEELIAFVDPQVVRIVLENLLSNAMKYTPSTGHIELRISLVAKDVSFVVQDSGCGIPAHVHDRIFDKFFRAENVQKLDTQGTGIGLYIAKYATEACGGTLWFESEEGKGSTFSFTIPRTIQ